MTLIELRLARHGVIVLLLGLLTGFVIGNFHNPHLGDAAHLTGLIGGFGMIAMGLLWPNLNLGRFWSGAGAWMTAVSMYLSWLGLAFRGAFGSGPNTNSPLLGSPLLWDRAGGVVLMMAALLSLFATLIVLLGLRRLTRSNERSNAQCATQR
jgi:hydroxylaminobenzene mutase